MFIASRALLQSHAEFNRLLWWNFLTCCSCLYYSSMQAVKILKLAFLPWPIKHLQLRVTKSNFPKLPVEEPNWVSFHQSAPSNHSNNGYNWSEKSSKISCNYHINNPFCFEGPLRVNRNSYLRDTFPSTGNCHNFFYTSK